MSHEHVCHKNKIVLLSRHVKLFHSGFATRVICVEQIVDMGDCAKSEPAIVVIKMESLFQSTLMHTKFLRKLVSEVLMPGTACVPVSVKTPPRHAHFSGLTSWWWLLSWHFLQEQSFCSSSLKVCRGCISRTTTPMLLCRTRKNQEKTVTTARRRVCSHHCGILLTTLYHEPRLEIRFLWCQNPTCANNFEIGKSGFQPVQFTLRQWQCCLVFLPFLPFACHGTSNNR